MINSKKVAVMAAVSALGFGSAAPVQAQNLTMAVGAQVTSLDPHYHALSPNLAVATMLFDTLTQFDSESRLEPGLAESWKPVEPTVWEFKLRPGVKFHNGNEFTADDVAFTIARVPTVPNSPSSYAIYTRAIDRVEIVDPLTVRFHTRSPYPLLPTDLGQIAILDKETHENGTTEEFNAGKLAVGTGPFRYSNFRSGDRLELERNDAYWGEKPHWARVNYRILPNDASRTAALLAGDVDFIDQVPTSDITALRRNDKVRLAEKDGLRIIFLALDHQHPEGSPQITGNDGKPLDKNPLRDLRVRQALSIGINRQGIVDRVMQGVGTPAGQMMPPGALGYNPNIAVPKYDPDAAKKLLADAGYPNGFRITLHGPNDRYMNDARIIQAVGQMWTRIGVHTAVEAQPFTTFIARAGRGETSAHLMGLAATTGEAATMLRSLVATQNREAGMGASNRGRYSNPALDAKLAEAMRTLDNGRREALLQDATRIMAEDQALIPVHIQKNAWAMRRNLTIDARADEYTRAQDVRPAE